MTIAPSRLILPSVPLWAKAVREIAQPSAARKKRRFMGSAFGLLRQRSHCLFEAGDGGRVHAVVHELLEDLDGLPVGPDLLGLGVEPDALGINFGDALDPDGAGFLVEVLDRAA